MEKTNFSPEKDKPKCRHCQQPHIDAHEFYYRGYNPLDPKHKEIKNQFTLCRVCAHCYNDSQKGIKLDKRIQMGFHEYTLYRHPIQNRKQWTCHTQSPKFIKYCQDLHEVRYGTIEGSKYEHKPCLSGLKGIVQDQTRY